MTAGAPCYIPTEALEAPGTADEIAVRTGLPVWPVWQALQRDVKRGRVRTERDAGGVTRYAIADRRRRNGNRYEASAEDEVIIRHVHDDRLLSRVRGLGDAVTWREVARKLRISKDKAKRVLARVATWDRGARVWRMNREEAA